MTVMPAAMGAAEPDVWHEDPAGDVERQLGESVDEPSVDIRLVTATRSNATLSLAMRIEGELRLAGDVEAGADRTYRYLFPVDLDHHAGERLLQQHDLTVLCQAREGEDLRCTTPQEQHIVRSVRPGLHWVNVTLELADDSPNGTLEAGGAATMTSANGTEVEAQDFTQNALPYAGGTGGTGSGDGTGGTPGAPAWWRTPWLLFAAVIVGVLAALAWNGRRR